MLEGVGVYTVGGVLVTILGGKLTPLSCYVGLGVYTGGGVQVEQPVGSCGCEYDINQIRLFVEHVSSPSTGSDHPGFNHGGLTYLIPVSPLTLYIGASVALDDFNDMDSPFLAVAGVETNGDVRFSVEHINDPTTLGPGHTVGGLKFVF